MSDYGEMLERLRAYRKTTGLKQRQMCEAVGVSQERYSYLENGQVKLTSDNLKALCAIGIDIDYLLTGNEYEYAADELDKALGKIDEPRRDFVMKILAEVIVEKWSYGGFARMSDDSLKNMHLLESALQSWDSFSMVGFVREDSGLSQFDMGQKLGVGVKKYRALEHEERYPDADMLLDLYKISGYPPTMFMDISDRRLLAIKAVWMSLQPEEKQEIIRFIKQLVKIV